MTIRNYWILTIQFTRTSIIRSVTDIRHSDSHKCIFARWMLTHVAWKIFWQVFTSICMRPSFHDCHCPWAWLTEMLFGLHSPPFPYHICSFNNFCWRYRRREQSVVMIVYNNNPTLISSGLVAWKDWRMYQKQVGYQVLHTEVTNPRRCSKS